MRVFSGSEIGRVLGALEITPLQGFYQSPFFADLSSMVGLEPELWVADDNSWANLVVKGHIPFKIQDLPVLPPLVSFISNRIGFCTWHDGPLCSAGDSGRVLGEVLDFARSKRLCLRNCSFPPSFASVDVPGIDRREMFTLKVRLDRSKDEAYESISKKGRKSIRIATEKGVEVKLLSSESEIISYHELLKSRREQLGLSRPPKLGLLTRQWKYLHSKDAMEVFLAMWNGELVAAMGVLHYKGNAIEVMSGQSETNYRENLFAGDLIKWKIIEWGIEKGLRSYDLGGVNPNPATEKEKAILQFKSKWGGELVKRYSISKNYTGIPFLGR